MKTSVRMRASGNHTRYAPITAAIAPEAPTTGTVEAVSTTTWATVATTPAAR